MSHGCRVTQLSVSGEHTLFHAETYSVGQNLSFDHVEVFNVACDGTAIRHVCQSTRT